MIDEHFTASAVFSATRARLFDKSNFVDFIFEIVDLKIELVEEMAEGREEGGADLDIEHAVDESLGGDRLKVIVRGSVYRFEVSGLSVEFMLERFYLCSC